MRKSLALLTGLACAAFLFHLASASTPYGAIRFELPFFLACLYAVRGMPRPWMAGCMFFIPALMYDFLDNDFSGSLSHLILFVLIRRLKLLINFERFPSSVFLGAVMAALDRLIYGLLAGFKMGLYPDLHRLAETVCDPAYGLTVLLLPVGFLLVRRG